MLCLFCLVVLKILISKECLLKKRFTALEEMFAFILFDFLLILVLILTVRKGINLSAGFLAQVS